MAVCEFCKRDIEIKTGASTVWVYCPVCKKYMIAVIKE